jgi:chromosome segregation protein
MPAALGDDIDASSDEAAPMHWKALPPLPGVKGLPAGVAPLSEFVQAPPALARRLAHVGVVEPERGPALLELLHPGQRLVTLEGDLWRWDGYSAAADAPTAAAQRLAERNRLVSLQDDSAAAARDAEAARTVLDEAKAELEKSVGVERDRRNDWRAANSAVEQARKALSAHEREMSEQLQKASALQEALRRLEQGLEEARAGLAVALAEQEQLPAIDGIAAELESLRADLEGHRATYADARACHDGLENEARRRSDRLKAIDAERAQWKNRASKAGGQIETLAGRVEDLRRQIGELSDIPAQFEDRRKKLMTLLSEAERDCKQASDELAEAENTARAAEADLREAEGQLSQTREEHARLEARIEAAGERRAEIEKRIAEILHCPPDKIAETAGLETEDIPPKEEIDQKLLKLRDQRERLGGVNLRAEEEAEEVSTQLDELVTERDDLVGAINKLRNGIGRLNQEGRQRLLEAFDKVNVSFGSLFTQLFAGGKAELQLIESDDPLEAGLEILAHPPGKRPQVLSLLSGGEQALTAMALIFAVFLTNPSPICVLDEVDAPLDDHNVERFCNLLDAMLERTDTRFLIITHHALTMARMHRLFGVTMMERGVSQLVSVDLQTAEGMREAS